MVFYLRLLPRRRGVACGPNRALWLALQEVLYRRRRKRTQMDIAVGAWQAKQLSKAWSIWAPWAAKRSKRHSVQDAVLYWRSRTVAGALAAWHSFALEQRSAAELLAFAVAQHRQHALLGTFDGWRQLLPVLARKAALMQRARGGS